MWLVFNFFISIIHHLFAQNAVPFLPEPPNSPPPEGGDVHKNKMSVNEKNARERAIDPSTLITVSFPPAKRSNPMKAWPHQTTPSIPKQSSFHNNSQVPTHNVCPKDETFAWTMEGRTVRQRASWTNAVATVFLGAGAVGTTKARGEGRGGRTRSSCRS